MSVFHGQYVVSANIMSLSRILKQLSGAILMIVLKEYIGALGMWALVIGFLAQFCKIFYGNGCVRFVVCRV